MAAVVLKPFLMRDCKFIVATHDYESHVSTIEFVPTSSPVVWKGLTPTSSHTFPTTATWVANVGYAQDWATANSLSRFLHDHEGESVEVIFEPVSGGSAVTATIVIAPGSIGGAVDTVAVGSVSLGVSGKPDVEAVV